MDKVPTARDCMVATSQFTLTPDTDVYKAIKVLVAKHASGAPVVDENGMLLGILTEKDCLRVLSRSAYDERGGGTGNTAVRDRKGRARPRAAVLESTW